MWQVECHERPSSGPGRRDADVVGIGALIAFAGSSFLAVAGMLIQYLLFQHPKSEDMAPADQEMTPPNPVDVIILQGFRKSLGCLGVRFRWWGKRRGDLSLRHVFEQCILAMADMQIAMSIAMLGYACASLSRGISAYDWWVIIGLVWFSIITNLAAQSCLRDHFTRYPNRRPWRVAVLYCLVGAVAASMMPTTGTKRALLFPLEQRDALLRKPVLCYFPGYGSEPGSGSQVDGYSAQAGLCLIVISLVVILLFSMLRLYARPDGLLMRWHRNYTGEVREPALGHRIVCVCSEQRYRLLIVRPFLASWLVLKLYADSINSIAAEILCISALAIWVALRFYEIINLVETKWSTLSLVDILLLVFFVAAFKPLADYTCGKWATVRDSISHNLSSASSGMKSLASQLREKLRKWKWQSGDEEDGEAGENEGLLDSVTIEPQPSESLVSVLEPGIQNGDIAGVLVGVDRDAYSAPERHFYFSTSWMTLALPILALSTILHIVLLLFMPHSRSTWQPARLLTKTLFWAIVYTPLNLFVFMLASMAAKDRVSPKSRARTAYRILSGIVTVLTCAAILDTIFGLGGTPMSYIAMGTAGLLVLVYLLYGCVAQSCRAAKGKDPEDADDVEECASLLVAGSSESSGRRRGARGKIAVRKKNRRDRGPSRRLTQQRGANYGTMTARQDE